MENLSAVGLLLILLGIILRLTYFNSKNYFFGYRTNLSMKNISNWNFANKLGAVYLIITGVYALFAGVLANYLLPKDYQINFVTVVVTFGLFISIFKIEKKLKIHDEKNNN
jgi:uncharacterized membrane protein